MHGCQVVPTGIGVEGTTPNPRTDTHILPHRRQGSRPQRRSIAESRGRVCRHPVGSGEFSELTASIIKRKGGEDRGENVSTKQPVPYGRSGICLLWHRAESDCNYSLLINSSVGESVREPINGGERCSTEGSTEHPITPAVIPPKPHPARGDGNHRDPAPQVPQQERPPTPAPSPGLHGANPFPLALHRAAGKSNSL